MGRVVPQRCLNARCPRKGECEYGKLQERTLEMFKDDEEGMFKYGAKPIYPVWVLCKRYKVKQ